MKAQSPSKEGKKSRSAPRRGSLEKTEPICLELDLCSELLFARQQGLAPEFPPASAEAGKQHEVP